MDDWNAILKLEFSAEEGSFLLQMRCELIWDKTALDRLMSAMELCCQASEAETSLERWVAEGFWYVSFYIKDWTTHENFPRDYSEEYYELAYEHLQNLAYWFFLGESPWEVPNTWQNELAKLNANKSIDK